MLLQSAVDAHLHIHVLCKLQMANFHHHSCVQGPHVMYTEWGKKYGKVFKVPHNHFLHSKCALLRHLPMTLGQRLADALLKRESCHAVLLGSPARGSRQ